MKGRRHFFKETLHLSGWLPNGEAANYWERAANSISAAMRKGSNSPAFVTQGEALRFAPDKQEETMAQAQRQAPARDWPFQVKPLHPALGCEISGITLAQAVEPKMFGKVSVKARSRAL